MCQIPGSAKDVSEGEMGWARRERHAYVMGVTATHDGDGDTETGTQRWRRDDSTWSLRESFLRSSP